MSRKRRKQEDVALNLAAMLDMAFQLLTFFILTFKPAPMEGQIDLRLPPPQAITGGKAQAGENTKNTDPVEGVNSLIISIFPTAGGGISQLAIGEGTIPGNSLTQLEARLKTVLADPTSPFDQIIVQVGSGLHYENLMKVIDVCTRQTLSDGKKLNKLSFVELPTE
jgi:biopolymer transport protein ExbD